MDRVLLGTKHPDVASYRLWAEQLGCGLELTTYYEPGVLAGDWKAMTALHKQQLAGFQGIVGLHGAFYDMVSASLDPDIVAVTRKRYMQNLYTASELGAAFIVFHLNYMGVLKFPEGYREGWHRRQVDFWGDLTQKAAGMGVTLLFENMWEDDPTLVTNILAEVDSPFLQACLDVAHVHLFAPQPLHEWIEALTPWLYNCHLNNHDGHLDLHWALGQGVIDYGPVLQVLRRLSQPPLFTLELPERSRIEASLPYFELPASPQHPPLA